MRTLPIPFTVAAVVATAVLIGSAFFLLSDGSGGGPPTEGTVGDAIISQVDHGFVRRVLSADEVPDEEYGIVFFDLETGQSELWSIPQRSADMPVRPGFYHVDPNHRWLQFGSGNRRLIADRRTGSSYEIQAEEWQINGGPSAEGMLVLNAGGAFAIVDLANAPTEVQHEFSLPITQPRGPAVFLGRGERALLDGHIADLSTGEAVRS
jgi:hypothetical protein